MKGITKQFIIRTEICLEASIRTGLLRWKNAYEVLCVLKDSVDKTIRELEDVENNKGPFNNISVKWMFLLVVASLISLL